jgi:hypothetical protein
MNVLYLCRGRVSCFEGEGAGAGAGDGTGNPNAAAQAAAAAAAAQAAAAASAGGAAGGAKTTFTQEDVNRFMAEDRRKHQTALAQMETKLQEALNDKSMTEATRKALEENLNAIQGQLRTKEQQLAHEKKQMEEVHNNETTELKKKAGFWENMYRESTVERALQDAAVKGDAFNAEQIVVLLRPMTKLLEVVDEKTGKTTGKYKPMVEMSDVDPKTGEPVQMVRTPEEAVKRMKELPETYGNLFKSGVVSGIGAGVATGGAPGGGRIDVRKLTSQQYREIRAKNPELLGLRPNRKKVQQP